MEGEVHRKPRGDRGVVDQYQITKTEECSMCMRCAVLRRRVRNRNTPGQAQAGLWDGWTAAAERAHARNREQVPHTNLY